MDGEPDVFQVSPDERAVFGGGRSMTLNLLRAQQSQRCDNFIEFNRAPGIEAPEDPSRGITCLLSLRRFEVAAVHLCGRAVHH